MFFVCEINNNRELKIIGNEIDLMIITNAKKIFFFVDKIPHFSHANFIV